MAYTYLLVAPIALLLIVLYRRLTNTNTTKILPPGPKGHPILGNISDLPPQDGTPEYLHWLTHKSLYGPLSSISFFGQTIVIIHDRAAAFDLLDKKARVTSSRPIFHFANLSGYERLTVNKQNGHALRKHRKLIHQEMGTAGKVEERFEGMMRESVARLLMRVLEEPGKVREHFQTESSASILQIVYGYTTAPNAHDDPLVRLIEQMMNDFGQVIKILHWIVDAIPPLKYLPAWLPGMSFQHTAAKYRQTFDMASDIPFDFTSNNAHGRPTVVSRLIRSYTNRNSEKKNVLAYDDQKAIKEVALAMYAAGAETTVSTLRSFVLAMAKFPEVQRKAQEEIDKVVGQGRLPGFEDRGKLLYVEAICKEALRWFPVAPTAIPHRTDEEVQYKGYTIPKGSILVPMVWWFLHDPEVYADPETFDPTRFIAPRNELDPATVAFGFGRRICPGRQLVYPNVFLTVAQFLAAFKVEKAIDEGGNPIEPAAEGIPGAINQPKPFPYSLTPRNKSYEELVRNLDKEFPWQKSDADNLGYHDYLQNLLESETH